MAPTDKAESSTTVANNAKDNVAEGEATTKTLPQLGAMEEDDEFEEVGLARFLVVLL